MFPSRVALTCDQIAAASDRVLQGMALSRTEWRPVVWIGAGVACVGISAACGPFPPLPTDPGAAGDPTGLAVNWSWPACATAEVDLDRDGLDDRCEFALTQAFAPVLVVSATSCNWAPDARPPRPGGGYRFAAGRGEAPGSIRVAYLPAYYRDCGWKGAKCWIPGVGCEGHSGDSEAIVVEVAWVEALGRWRAEGVFLSAHCFGRSAGGCRWYRGEELAAFRWADDLTRGAPVVWVAEGSNANYPSRSACDRGHWFVDTCDRNDVQTRFPLLGMKQNIGSREHPVETAYGRGCIGAEHLGWTSDRVVSGRSECFWSLDAPFRGWQWPLEGDAPTPYARYLEEIAGL